MSTAQQLDAMAREQADANAAYAAQHPATTEEARQVYQACRAGVPQGYPELEIEKATLSSEETGYGEDNVLNNETLKCSRTNSELDPYLEVTLAEYAKVYNFEQWAALQKYALRAQDEQADDFPESVATAGAYVRVRLLVPEAFARRYGAAAALRVDAPAASTLVLAGVNTYESHLSVLHFSLTLTGPAEVAEVTLQSKQPLTFQCGFRTFKARPIYSEDSRRADKHKLMDHMGKPQGVRQGQSIWARRCDEAGMPSNTGGWLRVTDKRFAHLSASVYVPLGTVVGEKLFVQVPPQDAEGVREHAPTGYGYRLSASEASQLATNAAVTQTSKTQASAMVPAHENGPGLRVVDRLDQKERLEAPPPDTTDDCVAAVSVAPLASDEMQADIDGQQAAGDGGVDFVTSNEEVSASTAVTLASSHAAVSTGRDQKKGDTESAEKRYRAGGRAESSKTTPNSHDSSAFERFHDSQRSVAEVASESARGKARDLLWNSLCTPVRRPRIEGDGSDASEMTGTEMRDSSLMRREREWIAAHQDSVEVEGAGRCAKIETRKMQSESETFMAAHLKPNLKWPKLHCDNPAPKQMLLNKICNFFVFLTSFFVFFLDGARTARWFFPAVRTKSHFSIPSRRRKIKTKKTAVPSRVALVRNFAWSPSPRYAVFLTAEKNESARYGGRKKNSRTQSPTSEKPRTFDNCVIQHCRT